MVHGCVDLPIFEGKMRVESCSVGFHLAILEALSTLDMHVTALTSCRRPIIVEWSANKVEVVRYRYILCTVSYIHCVVSLCTVEGHEPLYPPETLVHVGSTITFA